MNRQVVESPIEQGIDEKIAYTLITTPWGGSPSGVSVKLYEGEELTDRSSTMLTGVSSVVGDNIITPVVEGITLGEYYRLEIKFSSNGNVLEAYCIINATQ